MSNPWKLATIGMALVTTTALVTGLTTAYIMQPAVTADPQSISQTTAAPTAPAVRRASAPPTAYRPSAAVAHRPASVPAAVAVPAAPPAPPAPPLVASAPAQPAVYPPTATASVPADCATGADRTVRIAKPGVLGGLLGAGLGAAGGAIADGGKSAGKGAAIGAIAGAVLGTGYGAYKTKQECGTILGGTSAGPTTVSQSPSVTHAARVETSQAPFAPVAADRITVFDAR